MGIKNLIKKHKERITKSDHLGILKMFFTVQKKQPAKYATFSEALADYQTDEKTLQKNYYNFCGMAYFFFVAFIANLIVFSSRMFIDGLISGSCIFFGCVCFGMWFKGAAYAYSLRHQTLDVKRVLKSPADWLPDWSYKVKMVYRDKPNTNIRKY